MRAGQIDLVNLELPISLRPSATLTDEELMRFSEENKPYKIERNKYGELLIMTPVGGIGSTHEGSRLRAVSLEQVCSDRQSVHLERRLQSSRWLVSLARRLMAGPRPLGCAHL